jgi:hypothetical protein
VTTNVKQRAPVSHHIKFAEQRTMRRKVSDRLAASDSTASLSHSSKAKLPTSEPEQPDLSLGTDPVIGAS